MNIKDGIVHPLAILSNSSKPISTVEQRQYLYDQEKQLEKSVRYQEGISDSINKLVNSRENQIKYILGYQSNQQNIQVQAIEDIGWGINGLGDKIDYGMETLSNGMNILSNGLQQLNKTQLLGFQEELKALGILDYNVNAGFSNLLNSIESQTIIFQNISSQIGEIIETLHNPRKIEGLEYKKDAISNLQNKWFDESLEYFHLAAEKLTTDQEVYFLIGLIEFEENKNYEEAIINFEKAVKYANGYEDYKVYIQSLNKLASINFILAGKDGLNNDSKIKKAYEYQLKAVNTDNDYIWKKYINSGKTIDIKKEINEQPRYNLIKYSAIIGKYDTFEKNLYKLLRLNPSTLLNISIDPIFSKNPKILEIIDSTISKIKEIENQEKEEKEYNNNLEEKKLEITTLQKEINNIIKNINYYSLPDNYKVVHDIYTNGFFKAIKNNGDKNLEFIYTKNAEIFGTKGHIQYHNYDLSENQITKITKIPNGHFFLAYCSKTKKTIILGESGEVLYYDINHINWADRNLPYGYEIYEKCIIIKGHNHDVMFGGLDSGDHKIEKVYNKANNSNTSIIKILKDKGYPMIEVWPNKNKNDWEKISLWNGLIETHKNSVKEYQSALNKIDYQIDVQDDKYWIDDKILYKALNFNGRWNFLKGDGTLLLKSIHDNDPDYFYEFKKKDQGMKLLIKKYLIGDFNKDGEGKIKILNEIYSVTRKEKIYGGYEYKIDF